MEEITKDLGLEYFHLLAILWAAISPFCILYKIPKSKITYFKWQLRLFENGMGDSYPKRRDYADIKAKTAITFYDPAIATKELVDEIYETVNSRKAIQIISLAKSTIRNNVEKELHRIKMTVCLIWGKNDTITPPCVASSFKRLIPHAQLHWIDECAHVPMLETPESFKKLLDDFLNTASNSKSKNANRLAEQY